MARGIQLSPSSPAVAASSVKTPRRSGRRSIASPGNGIQQDGMAHGLQEMCEESSTTEEIQRAGKRRQGRRKSVAFEEPPVASRASERALRYSARYQARNEASTTQQDVQAESHAASAATPPRSRATRSLLPSLSYPVLVTISIALLAWVMVQPVAGALSCQTDTDCIAKGNGECKQDRSKGASTCVYKSCSAGYWGAGNTYSDCYECPHGMTSLEGKAFYASDCFIACGEERCYKPENGSTECSINAASVTPLCISKCNDKGFKVLNANKPYATCIRNDHLAGGNATLTNQSPKLAAVKPRKVVPLDLSSSSNGNAGSRSDLQKRSGPNKITLSAGRRLRLKEDVDLHAQGPAVALLRNAGRDPLALVSK